ncbi:MAG: adenylyltransferase/cytidyltransferase family protein [Candidatus Woesearchaeota archaeon]|nr:adenylyltransferase/cytidyltransferase family protein [Candidatus Woesearchaeota archaeon]
MRKVMVFGTFDILHAGHINFLEQAREECIKHFYKEKDEEKPIKLVAVIARDINAKKAKGIFPINNERTRLENIKKLGVVDEAIMGEFSDKYKIIEKIKPDLICLGYDQEIPKNFEEELKKRKINAKIVRLKAYKPEIFKSSKMRK